MLKRPVVTLAVSASLLLGMACVSAWGAYGGARQYYGHYRYNTSAKYYYRPYYYKPRASYSGYKHHYTVYYPSRPKYQYYYNPYKKAYWGRCPAKPNGKPEYSLLKEEDRKPTVDEIAEDAFPPMGELPPIPDSDPGDTEKLELPPDDLPTSAAKSDLPK